MTYMLFQKRLIFWEKAIQGAPPGRDKRSSLLYIDFIS
jgi:hypothetical protein